MPDTMIERVAAVLAKHHIMNRDGRTEDDPYVVDWAKSALQHPEEFPSEFVVAARAALTAMREPTTAMQKAAFAPIVSFRSTSGMSDLGQLSVEYEGEPDKGSATVFRSMIDAALAEG